MLRQVISNDEITFSGSLEQLVQRVISLDGILPVSLRTVIPQAAGRFSRFVFPAAGTFPVLLSVPVPL